MPVFGVPLRSTIFEAITRWQDIVNDSGVSGLERFLSLTATNDGRCSKNWVIASIEDLMNRL
jgi:hypothetical protein